MEKYFFGNIPLESLVKYIEGSVSVSEKQLVEDWISDERHRAFFLKLKEAWLSPLDIEPLRKENMERDWKKILSGIEEFEVTPAPPQKDKRVFFKVSPALFRAAAVLLIIFSIAGAYFTGRKQSPVFQGSDMSYNEIYVPKGQRSHISMSDGSTIWINADSRVRFQNNYGGESRDIWLEGEAFFEVAKDISKPFYVHTSDLKLKVHGTSFNVKAYPDEDIIETTLVEGSFSFEMTEAGNRSGEVFLEPNHKALYLKKEAQLVTSEVGRETDVNLEPGKIIISEPVEVEPVISWTDGKLVFEDEPFEEIAVKLERKYDIEIFINSEDIKKTRYTGVLRDVSIEQALKAIQLSMPISYSIKDNEVNIIEKSQ